MYRNIAIGILGTFILCGLWIINVELKNFNNCSRTIDVLSKITAGMETSNFQDKDDMSAYSDGSNMSLNYGGFLQTLRVNGMHGVADELQSGYALGITAANYQISYLDEDKLEQNIQDFIDNNWYTMTSNGTPLSSIAKNIEVEVNLEGPNFVSANEASMIYYGKGDSIGTPSDMFDSDRNIVIDYRVTYTITFDVKPKMLITRIQLDRFNTDDFTLPGSVTTVEHYSMFN